MNFAAIDIGSNAGRLLVASVFEKNNIPVTEKITLVRVPLQLGVDVFENGKISEDKIEMLIHTFEAYKQLTDIYIPQDIIVCATDAIRNAANGDNVIERVKKETGFDIIKLSGKQEAEFISKAVNSNLTRIHNYAIYIDVGGGSTEISLFRENELIKTKSFEIGTIRLMLDTVPLNKWDEMKHWIEELRQDNMPVDCICSGGNINKLTKLYGNRNKNTLSYSRLVEAHEFLEGHPIEYLISEMGLRKDRAEVIAHAAIIFKKIMNWGHIQELHAPKIGLADGLVVELYKKYNNMPSLLD